MNRRTVTVCALLFLGAGVLFLLQREQITARIGLRPLFYLLADAQRGLERIPLALTRVTAEEENRIGEELARGYRYATPKDDPAREAIQAALTRMGERLTGNVRREGIRYRFHYLPEKSLVNAFALPGGQIFVGRGMLELLETEDELAAVLGHEIAHVDRRHCIERMQYELKARQLGLGGFYRLGSIAVRLFQVGYTKDQEFEADRAGLELAVEAGYAPAGALGVMDKFLELGQRAGDEPLSPVEEAASVALGSWREYFRSHPPPGDRRAQMEREAASRGWPLDQEQTALTLPLKQEPGR